MENKKNITKKAQELHALACEQNEDYYIDPDTGYFVATEHYLLKQEYCCQCDCRHCPY
jgi:hypothetical protein